MAPRSLRRRLTEAAVRLHGWLAQKEKTVKRAAALVALQAAAAAAAALGTAPASTTWGVVLLYRR